MTSDQIVITTFVRPLKAAFGSPRKAEDDAIEFMAGYVRVLRAYPASVLTQAVDHILSNRDKRGWPLVAECKAVCERFMPRKQPATAGGIDPHYPDLANRVCAERAIGKRAAEEGWIVELWEFVNKYGREPAGDIEIKRIKFDADATCAKRDEILATIAPDAEGISGARRRFYKAHLDRETRLVERVLHGGRRQ
jgi:hypothetical protein